MQELSLLHRVLAQLGHVLGIDDLEETADGILSFLMLKFNVEVATDFVHLLVVLQNLEEEVLWRHLHVVGLNLLRSLVKIFEEKDKFSWVDVGLFEPVYHLSVVNCVQQELPASI
jgi:hypothetical protein